MRRKCRKGYPSWSAPPAVHPGRFLGTRRANAGSLYPRTLKARQELRKAKMAACAPPWTFPTLFTAALSSRPLRRAKPFGRWWSASWRRGLPAPLLAPGPFPRSKKREGVSLLEPTPSFGTACSFPWSHHGRSDGQRWAKVPSWVQAQPLVPKTQALPLSGPPTAKPRHYNDLEGGRLCEGLSPPPTPPYSSLLDARDSTWTFRAIRPRIGCPLNQVQSGHPQAGKPRSTSPSPPGQGTGGWCASRREPRWKKG